MRHDEKELNYKEIRKFDMLWLLASSLAIKYSQGEYILLATGDTYYHHSFKDLK